MQDLETGLLLEALFQVYGSDFRGYERSALAPRLSDFMQQQGFETLSQVQDRVIRDCTVAAGLLRALAFRPAGAFEEAQAFGAVRELAEPLLRSYARPRIWIPECATIEEIAAWAILLEEAGIYDRALIHVTSSSPALLGEIREARFPLEQAEEYAANYRAAGGKEDFSAYWSARDGDGVFDSRLLRGVSFSEYNLSTDTSFNEFHLIVCRGRLPELGAALRRRVLELFAGSLARFGILFADPVDELDSYPFADDYRIISRVHGIYRRTYRVDTLKYNGIRA